MTSRGERLDLLWSSLASKPGCASDTPGNVVRCCRLWGRIWCRLSCCRSQIGPKFVFFKTPVATSHWCRLPRCGGIRSSYLGKVGGGTCKHQAKRFFFVETFPLYLQCNQGSHHKWFWLQEPQFASATEVRNGRNSLFCLCATGSQSSLHLRIAWTAL